MSLLKKLRMQQSGKVATAIHAIPAVSGSQVDKANCDPIFNSDLYCWPQSAAMNSGEIYRFLARRAGFCNNGLELDAADVLADKLVIRDREKDDRVVCYECVHLRGITCKNSHTADVPQELPKDFLVLMQRCPGFKGWK